LNDAEQLKRTLLAIIWAVLLSLVFAPHSGSGRSLLRFAGYAHGPFFIMPSYGEVAANLEGSDFCS
jgi:hypothetical protein